MIGVININKPRGVTSSQVVVKIKKLLNLKRVGHMGTLDPLAQGVLPICIGKATRLFDYFLKKQKTYIATFEFGKQTTTLDLEGEVEKTSEHIPNYAEIENSLKEFKGKIMQLPPVYSSKKVGGKKACDEIRRGNSIELKPCEVEIFEYKLLKQIDSKTFEFQITCSAGTYIRSLARDLGEAVGSCATMTKLIRTKSGVFDLNSAVDFDTLTQDIIQKEILSLESVLRDFESIEISSQNFQRLLNGLKLDVNAITNIPNNIKSGQHGIQYYKVICQNKIVGIGVVENNTLKIKTYLLDD